MQIPQKEITLPVTGIKVFIAQGLTYGEYSDLNAVYLRAATAQVKDGQATPSFNGEAIIAHNKKKLAILVKKIVGTDGKNMPVTPDFINALPQEDGMLIENECDAVLATIKKKKN